MNITKWIKNPSNSDLLDPLTGSHNFRKLSLVVILYNKKYCVISINWYKIVEQSNHCLTSNIDHFFAFFSKFWAAFHASNQHPFAFQQPKSATAIWLTLIAANRYRFETISVSKRAKCCTNRRFHLFFRLLTQPQPVCCKILQRYSSSIETFPESFLSQ